MARPVSQPIRAEAVRIVLQEEADLGWKASEIGVATEERRLGCDLLSIPPGGGEPHPVEVKGWGEPFLSNSGRFRYDQDIRCRGSRCRWVRCQSAVAVIARWRPESAR